MKNEKLKTENKKIPKNEIVKDKTPKKRDFQRAKELFKDRLDPSLYFDSDTSENAKKKILNTIRKGESNLTFLIGAPGTGKTYLVKLVNQVLKEQIVSIIIDNPFFSEARLMHSLLKAINRKDINPNDTERVKEIYRGIRHTIFIDEAQLLNITQMELIRILSDTKVFNFVLVMHQKESEEILKKAHFRTRSKTIINIGMLKKEEILRYIQKTLLTFSSTQEFAYYFEDDVIKDIFKYTNGNFRTLKAFIHTTLELMEYAHNNFLTKYDKIDNCISMMAAIDLGLINE